MGASSAGPHGVLIVDKPLGPTSHDIVSQARRLFSTRRVGHAGTLDPMATGVLVLLFGEATKLSGIATADDKRYRAEIAFGRATDSFDAEGATTAELDPLPAQLDAAAIGAVLACERARTEQVPPTVSALKLHGTRAHRLHRAGEVPVLAPRPVRVFELELLEFQGARARAELLVSKGYYVRALARDVGEALGVPAHLSELRRLASGGFSLDDANPWPVPPERARWISLGDALRRWLPVQRLTQSGVQRARRGQLLELEDFLDAPPPGLPPSAAATEPPSLGWTDAGGAPVALGQACEGGFRVRRGFAAEIAT